MSETPERQTGEEIEKAVREALDRIVKEDDDLFRMRAGERAFTFRLGLYLQCRFPKWKGNVTPDVILHRRGKDGPNLLAIEAKTASNLNERLELEAVDLLKLKGYRDDHKYPLTAFIVFDDMAKKPTYRVDFQS